MIDKRLPGMLDPYKALDLTDEKGQFCGKLLGDLGADVIKIEKPGGDPSRNIGPFIHDEPDPEKSLHWFAFNTSKRGLTLDIETADGQAVFKKLIRRSDFILESFPPGYMNSLGLGYDNLEKINPEIIMVSITPFGQTGPYKDYTAPDIVAWAMGGHAYPIGNPDRPPLRISHHSQSYLHASSQAAVAAMLALHYRGKTGEGQHVDVSIQEAVLHSTDQYETTGRWDAIGEFHQRGKAWLRPDLDVMRSWPCKDGHIIWIYWFGASAHWVTPLIDWMAEEGQLDDYVRDFDFKNCDWSLVTPEILARLQEPTLKFFKNHTKAEIYLRALTHRIQIYPISTMDDILNDPQLAGRDFWVDLEHPELGTSIRYPGAFAQASETAVRVERRAPLIGEHNREIDDELLSAPGKKGVIPKYRGEKKLGKLLEGIKVADFTWALVGPISTKILSDWGAEVIKIEGATRPDSRRVSPPFKDNEPGLNRSCTFNPYSTGKRSIALNLADPMGIDIAKRIVEWADIVADNFAGGAMVRMGLGYDVLKQINPDIIMLSSSGMGQTGPHPTAPTIGVHLTALAGIMNIAGWPDREPVGLDSYTDFISPHFNALAVLAALDYRKRTGIGQYLDLSQYEDCVHFMGPLVLDYTVNQRVGTRMGNRSPSAAPHNAYRCRGDDRWCVIAVSSEKEWEHFCGVIGNPAWTREPGFSTFEARKENEGRLDGMVEEWTINHSAEDVMTLMQDAGVSAGVVQTAEDMLEQDPQFKHRHFFWELDHPEVGKYRAPRQPYLLSKISCDIQRSPLLGEHNEYVLNEIIGMSDDEIEELVIAEVLE